MIHASNIELLIYILSLLFYEEKRINEISLVSMMCMAQKVATISNFNKAFKVIVGYDTFQFRMMELVSIDHR